MPILESESNSVRFENLSIGLKIKNLKCVIKTETLLFVGDVIQEGIY